MMKVSTQSPIKEVPAKPRQKNFKKPTRQRLKRSPRKQQKRQLEDTSTKKKPDKPTQTKVIPNVKGNDKKFLSLKEKIAKLQRELQSQFDTTATVMRKFKETKKMHDDNNITQKTSNAEAQPENEKKKTKVSQKAEPTKNIEEKAPDKTKPKDAQKQKEEKPPFQKSQDQKTSQKPQSSAKSPQKETQKKKEDKQSQKSSTIVKDISQLKQVLTCFKLFQQGYRCFYCLRHLDMLICQKSRNKLYKYFFIPQTRYIKIHPFHLYLFLRYIKPDRSFI
ncbi:Hypothetical_protein [Hexamita inflata]|uniref:Hypothetical_protein n=1 Tax=Hexamita inflata TaxID=28002 RepID=A0AA86NJN8_9EUKA|nr:Hypothetical protein HINF_LOCUS8874 [Hexamita inflata]